MVNRKIILWGLSIIFSITTLSLFGCGGGGSAGTSFSPETSALLSSIEDIEWNPITSTENICENQVLIQNIQTQLDLQDNPSTLSEQFKDKLETLKAMVASASISISVSSQTELEDSLACIDDSIQSFALYAIENADPLFTSLKAKINIANLNDKTPPIAKKEDPAAEEEVVSCSEGYDICGVCNGPGKSHYYKDFDQDGLGNPNDSAQSCSSITGYVSNANDVNDFCTGSTCYVTSNSLASFCNNTQGCSLYAAISSSNIHTLFFHINSTEESDKKFNLTSPLYIEKDLNLYACNQVRDITSSCSSAQQIHIDGSLISGTDDYNSATIIIRNTNYNADPITVQIKDLIVENNTNTFGVWTHHSYLSLNGKSKIQNNRGAIAGGILAGWFIGQTTVTLNDEASINNNQSINDFGSGGVLLSNTSLILNDSSQINHNTSTNGTGGVRLFGRSELFLNDHSQINNNLGEFGGAINGFNDLVKLSDSAQISFNQAPIGSAIYLTGSSTLWLASSSAQISNNVVSNESAKAVHFQTNHGNQGRLILGSDISADSIIQGNTHTPSGLSADHCAVVAQAGIISITDLLNNVLYSGSFHHLNCE